MIKPKVMWLSVKIGDKKKGKELARFLRTIEYVESVDEKNKQTPLKEEDWIKPGRPAMDEEIELLAEEMEKEEGGIEAKEFFNDLKKKIAG